MTASTILSKPNAVNVYDSLYDSVDEKNLKIIQQLFGIKEVHVVPVQKQQGFSDCGLFSIACAVYLAKKRTPEKANHRSGHINFNQLPESWKNVTLPISPGQASEVNYIYN